jgi:hypothetical protein
MFVSCSSFRSTSCVFGESKEAMQRSFLILSRGRVDFERFFVDFQNRYFATFSQYKSISFTSVLTHAAGTDIKSVLLNVSSISFFILPFIIYYLSKRQEADLPFSVTVGYSGAVAVAILLYAVAYITPPMGWRRPHPYSDDPTNLPHNYRAKIN